jgi:hypothetical protein
LAVGAPFFIPGEFMEWDLTWRGITGGQTRLMVGQPGVLDGRRAIVVRSETRSDGLVAMFRHVRDDLITTIDLTNARPISSAGAFEFGNKSTRVRSSRLQADFASDRFFVRYQKLDRPEITWTQRLPPQQFVYDSHSVLGVLRAWSPQVGERAYFFALNGRRLYRVDVVAIGREKLRTALGRFTASRMEGQAVRLTRALTPSQPHPPRAFTIWLTEDENRVPVRMQARTEYGDVQAELSGYQRGESRPVALRAAR